MGANLHLTSFEITFHTICCVFSNIKCIVACTQFNGCQSTVDVLWINISDKLLKVQHHSIYSCL
jgi:hypothetical protein